MLRIKVEVRSLGEFGLIDALRRQLASRADVLVGIGDDAAVVRCPPQRDLVLTTDMALEGVHFRLDWTSPYDLGRKVMASNVSDLAAMGAEPAWALVSIGLAPSVSVDWIQQLYKGLEDELKLGGGAVVGGDTISSQTGIVINIALLGWVPTNGATLRRGAQVGDVVCVTGQIGDAAAGLYLLQHPNVRKNTPADTASHLITRQLRPTPRLTAGQSLRAGHPVQATAMADLSDGLAGDLERICTESGVGAQIWVKALPLSAPLRALCSQTGQDPLVWALHGGEDYELVFTAPVAAIRRLVNSQTEPGKKALAGSPSDCPDADLIGAVVPLPGETFATVVGQIRSTPGVWAATSTNEPEKPLVQGGFRHL